jgi:hypothetical protein
MAITDKEQIQHYLILAKKSEIELRAICEGLSLSIEGSKQDLFNRLIEEPSKPQNDIMSPQAIPLRVYDNHGKHMPKALQAYLTWRGQIFHTKAIKKFKLLNQKNQVYERELAYISCPLDVLNTIIKEQWYDLRHSRAHDMVNILKKQPQDFKTSIVQMPVKEGCTYIMLHVEPIRRQVAQGD